MIRTFKIAGTLFLVGILLIFSVAHLRNRNSIRAQNKKGPTPAARQSIETPSAERAPQTGQPNAVFYTSVGGSSTEPQKESRGASDHARFTIEVAQFHSQHEAEALLLRLKSRGIEGFYTPIRKGGEVLYRVRLGVYANPDDAGKVLSRLAKSNQINGQVTKLQ